MARKSKLASVAAVPKSAGAKRVRKASGDAGAVEPVVVYVHGIGAQPPKSELKRRWDLALFGRDLGARSRMAYWSDLLHPPSDGGGPGPQAKSASRAISRAFDPAATLQRAGVDPANAEAVLFAEAMAQQLGAEAVTSGAGPGKKVLPLPPALRRPLARLFLESFVADTAAYFFRSGLRKKIRARLREQLDLAPGQPVTVVAHSQGSVIAYEVLSEMAQKGLQLDALVTIGSPLGIQEVQDFLEPGDLSVPGVVTRWHNFADLLDPVALDKRLADDFDDPNRVIRDERVRNTGGDGGFNPHAAVGYLAHPRVRQAVNQAMRLDPMARFLVARDVAERLGDEPGRRQPVLIELLEPGYCALDESDEQRRKQEAKECAGADATTPSLAQRVQALARALATQVSDPVAAHIDPLQRFVAARLTPEEVERVAAEHGGLRVYAVWRNSPKRKYTDGRSMRAVKADAALHGFGADGRGITWAVLDTGIRRDHPHFAQIDVQVWDCTQPGAPVARATDRDRDGHGTHVAGIIAGASADGMHRGVAPRARLVVYKVLDDQGQGEDAWIIKALDHIGHSNDSAPAGLAVHGINLSLGSAFDPSVYGCGHSPVCSELRRLWRRGVLAVVASGNEGMRQLHTPEGVVELPMDQSIGDPANLEECIAVGAVHCDNPHTYGVWAYSSRGPTADGRAKPDVVAPGERIESCNAAFRGPASQYRVDSGTSMAAPHVSGLLAAFLSVRPEFRGRPDEVKRLLLASCTDLARDRYHQGHGLPNLMQMLLNV